MHVCGVFKFQSKQPTNCQLPSTSHVHKFAAIFRYESINLQENSKQHSLIFYGGGCTSEYGVKVCFHCFAAICFDPSRWNAIQDDVTEIMT